MKPRPDPNSFFRKQIGPEIVKYIFSGLASGITMYLSGLVIKSFGASALVSSIIAALLSFIVSYVLQRFWVFNAAKKSTFQSAWKFVLVTSVTWTVGLSWIWFADKVLLLAYEWSQLVLVVIVSVMNFTINKLWTFK